MSDPLIGTLISGRYRVDALLGSGGMGAVYLVTHTQLRRRFALKLLHAETCKVPEMVARFEREAMAAANVDHPNIAFATDFGRTEKGEFFLVLEYLEGQRLRDALASGPLAVRRAVHIARQVASALERSHELGVIHRDLKPENIMLVPRGGDPDFVKVLDFGLAKVATETKITGGEVLGQALTKHGTLFGTPRYMAPEQCVSGSIDGRADLYALGLILYEMLAGVSPVGGKNVVQIISNQIATPTPPIKNVAPAVNVPASLEAVVMRLTEKMPEKRYENAAALLAALAEVAAKEGLALATASGGAASGPPSAPPTRPPDGVGQTVASVEVLSVGGTVPDLRAEERGEPAPSKEAPPKPALVVPSVIDFAAAKKTGATAPAQPSAPQAKPLPSSPSSSQASNIRSLISEISSRLPEPLRKKPLLVLIPLAGLLLILFLRIASKPAGQAQAPGTVPKPAAAVKTATKEQIRQAASDGIQAVITLAEQYPQDARVHRTLAHMYMAQQDGVQAMRELAKTLALDSSLVVDGEIIQALGMARTPSALEECIGLLAERCGARGVDVLYALAFRPGPGAIKTRAAHSLESPSVRAKASAATAVALDLRAATKCEDRRGLLPRASKEGDQRALQQLKALQPANNCGPYGLLDCWSCLRQGSALQDAIAAIEARVGKD